MDSTRKSAERWRWTGARAAEARDGESASNESRPSILLRLQGTDTRMAGHLSSRMVFLQIPHHRPHCPMSASSAWRCRPRSRWVESPLASMAAILRILGRRRTRGLVYGGVVVGGRVTSFNCEGSSSAVGSHPSCGLLRSKTGDVLFFQTAAQAKAPPWVCCAMERVGDLRVEGV